MNVLAIIPAKGTSKRLPGKNIRELSGQPLLAWSIGSAIYSKYVKDVIVSSDSDEIGKVAKHYGAQFLKRPKYLATDTASTDHVMVHVLRQLKDKPDLVVLLQPTCPLRPHDLVDKCIDKLIESDAHSLLTVHRDQHFGWQVFGDRVLPLNCGVNKRKVSQKIDQSDRLYLENGSVYVTRTDMLVRSNLRVCGRVTHYEIPKEYTVDIDTEYDFWLAEQWLAHDKLREKLSA